MATGHKPTGAGGPSLLAESAQQLVQDATEAQDQQAATSLQCLPTGLPVPWPSNLGAVRQCNLEGDS